MHYTPGEWQRAFATSIMPKIPTIRRLFGDQWLQDEAKNFQHATRQTGCNPLVALLVNEGQDQAGLGHDAGFLETLFKTLEPKLAGTNKVQNIKRGHHQWHSFIPLFGELLLGYHLERHNQSIRLEPLGRAQRGPDLDWKSFGNQIGFEVNAVTEIQGIRDDRADYQDQLKDAQELSQLVTEYRNSLRNGLPHSTAVQNRLAEVTQWHQRWEDPAPKVFGGMVPIRPRYGSTRIGYMNIRRRKMGAEQLQSYKHKVLALVLPTEYFPRPYHFRHVTEIRHHQDKQVGYLLSGSVFSAFYGLRDEPIYAHTHFDPETRKAYGVREHDRNNGRFINRSVYHAALLCSLGVSQGVIETPIKYSFILYEPYSLKNRQHLLPSRALSDLIKACDINLSLSKKVFRFPGGSFFTSKQMLSLWRRFTGPTKMTE